MAIKKSEIYRSLWASCDELRGSMDASQYKDYVLVMLFMKLYRLQLKTQITPLIEKWEKTIGVTVQDWQVKQMKTKWGACNIEKARIWLNLELAKKTEECLEFIIVHELVHLLERHHNQRFQFLMTKYLPNWKQLKTELNKLPISHSDWSY